MLKTLSFLLLSLSFLGLVFASNVNHYEYSRTIFLHNRQIDTAAVEPHTNFAADEFGLFYITFKPMLPSQPVEIEKFETDFDILLDDYLPVSTYFLYAPHKTVEAISQDARVVWVGAVPYIDKLPFNASEPTPSSKFTAHFAVCQECPTLAEEISLLAARMGEVFPASAFTWGQVSEGSQLVSLTINDESKQEQMILWIVKKGTQRLRFLEAVPLFTTHSQWESHVVADGFFECPTAQPANDPSACDYSLSVAPLTGSGQIIAICDSGVDTNNCFFEDPSAAVPVNDINTGLRKIVSYIDLRGDTLDNTGHGTFVASLANGVAGGSSSTSDVNSNAMFNGIAPNAKLLVMDVLKEGEITLNIPTENLDTELLNIMVNPDPQSRIGLFPWGATITQAGAKPYYSSQDNQVDDFIYSALDEKDFVAIFSVGNLGFNGPSRVTSAATAKNTIGVGGSLNAHESFVFTNYVENAEALAQAQYSKYCTIGDVSAYSDIVFCTSFNRPAPCPLFQQVLCIPTGFTGTAASCCAYPYLSPLCCPSTIYRLWSSSSLLFSPHSIYPQSSRGPTYDGRIKPDVLAPAQRLFGAVGNASSSSPFCGTWNDSPQPNQAVSVQEGTSGSAGLVAGAAALVREWLQGGYWPTGDPTSPEAATFPTPPASLIKALLINSAETLEILNSNGNAFYQTVGNELYSATQGFGRINLKNVLKTVNNPTDNIWIANNVLIPYSNFTYIACVNIVENASYVRITAVWTDPPASTNAGVALVNNIDLILVREDGFEYRANRKATFDSVNNVEDIYLVNPPAGSYSIMLHGTYITSSIGQFVDLVFRGDIDCSDGTCIKPTPVCASISRICPMDCSLRGASVSCLSGKCICSPPYYGVDCSLSPCPNNCNGNGVCNGETGLCQCDDFWKGTDCSSPDPTGTPAGCNTVVILEDCSDAGVDQGIVIGVTIGAFFFGAVVFFILGAWLSMQTMLRRKKKMIAKYRQMKAHEAGGGASSPMHQISPDDDE